MNAGWLAEVEALRERGALEDARRRCEAMLAESPKDARALAMMAALAADQGELAAALDWAVRSLEIDATSAGIHYTLGRIRQAEGEAVQAEQWYRNSILLDPGRATAHNNLGCVLQMQGRVAEAIAAFRRALEIEPRLAQAQLNLGALTGERALLEQAIAGYAREAQADPRNPMVCHDLGNVHRELGQLDEAMEMYDEAIRRDPECAEAHYARALTLLQLGRWEEAWREHEWRWRVKALATRPRGPQGHWDGSDLGKGTLLLHAEQGMGDSIQFARYAPLAARRCGSLIIECQPPLVRLFASLEGAAKVISWGDPLPPFDAHLPMMSLGKVFNTTPDTVPWNGPYLQASPQKARQWSLLRVPGLRQVGIVWAGQPQQGDDRKRSLTLSALGPLAAAADVRFVSLQKGEAARELKNPPPGMHLVDCGPELNDFSDTAAAIANLDLVISVDTSVAHLAGAMGVPTWVMVRFDADWRWMGEGGKTPWYPTARVFRQGQEGQWEPVVRQIAAALATLA